MDQPRGHSHRNADKEHSHHSPGGAPLRPEHKHGQQKHNRQNNHGLRAQEQHQTEYAACDQGALEAFILKPAHDEQTGEGYHQQRGQICQQSAGVRNARRRRNP